MKRPKSKYDAPKLLERWQAGEKFSVIARSLGANTQYIRALILREERYWIRRKIESPATNDPQVTKLIANRRKNSESLQILNNLRKITYTYINAQTKSE